MNNLDYSEHGLRLFLGHSWGGANDGDPSIWRRDSVMIKGNISQPWSGSECSDPVDQAPSLDPRSRHIEERAWRAPYSYCRAGKVPAGTISAKVTMRRSSTRPTTIVSSSLLQWSMGQQNHNVWRNVPRSIIYIPGALYPSSSTVSEKISPACTIRVPSNSRRRKRETCRDEEPARCWRRHGIFDPNMFSCPHRGPD